MRVNLAEQLKIFLRTIYVHSHIKLYIYIYSLNNILIKFLDNILIKRNRYT